MDNQPTGPEYVELRCATSFSFLRGASHPEELVDRAHALGYRALAITDRNGLYGVVRAHDRAKTLGLDVIVGAEVQLDEARSAALRSECLFEPARVLLLATDRKSYGLLCRLLTRGRRRTGKGGFQLFLSDVATHSEGLLAIHVGSPFATLLAQEKDIFGDRLWLSIERTLSPLDNERIARSQSIAAQLGVPLVATGGVLMHARERKPLQDVLTCIRLGVRLQDAGRKLLPNAASYLKSAREMASLFFDWPDAVARTVEIAAACRFRLSELRHEFALELLPPGETGMSYLRKLVEKGARERFLGTIPENVSRQIEHELKLIDTLDFAGYFLTVWDIVRYARSCGILCQGRGSAANSVVCYCLGITSIDPVRMNLLFERFISVERGEPPDIDVDFEHERREEVMQYVYKKYGRDHAAMVANLICYRAKLAYREVGKVFGLGTDQIDHLTRGFGYWSSGTVSESDIAAAGLDPSSQAVRQAMRWAEVLQGFPRHLGIHSGGFVITRTPVVEMVPVENATMAHRTVIAWDKRDVERLGLVKIDLLSLGMLTAVRRTFDAVQETEGLELSLANIPAEDPKIYDMICDADTVGTFQVESRAQMQMLPRLRPRTFYDLVVSVAIVRPGPIQGDMIHPYLRRRDGLEKPDYPHPALEEILGRTYGVPLFQEQVMKMAVAVAGFTPGEADELRRAIGWRSQIHIEQLHRRLVIGMRKNGLSDEFAERIFRMIQGFGGYGFPESHAASFALISYASCYLKRYHPAAFLTALLNSQPMGFYAPHSLVADAQRHGVLVRPPSVCESAWDTTLSVDDDPAHHKTWWATSRASIKKHTPWADEMQNARTRGVAVQPVVRLGLRVIRGLRKDVADAILDARRRRAFKSIEDVIARAAVSKEAASRLAAAGAFDDFGMTRRQALWTVMAIDRTPLLRTVRLSEAMSSAEHLPPMSEAEHMRSDYATTGLCVTVHPVAFVRAHLRRLGALGFLELQRVPHGRVVQVGGMVVTRQRPSTASGVIFMTVEDEDGHMNLVVFDAVYQRFVEIARDATMLIAKGKVERTRGVVNVVVDSFSTLEAPEPPVQVARNFR
ncbi:MAG: error-prone DNA polymerase [Deltaproteobacteria bacterium]|nr:error-prone DNA polymerase [Deltaproteobacteria bacterium]